MARAARRALALAAVLTLGACSAVPESLNPFSSGQEPAPAAATPSQGESGANKPFPNLASVPERPDFSTRAERDSVAQGLRADRDAARYTDQQVRLQSDETNGRIRPPQARQAAAETASPRPEPAPSRERTLVEEAVPSVAATPAPAAAPPPPPAEVRAEIVEQPSLGRAEPPPPAPAPSAAPTRPDQEDVTVSAVRRPDGSIARTTDDARDTAAAGLGRGDRLNRMEPAAPPVPPPAESRSVESSLPSPGEPVAVPPPTEMPAKEEAKESLSSALPSASLSPPPLEQKPMAEKPMDDRSVARTTPSAAPEAPGVTAKAASVAVKRQSAEMAKAREGTRAFDSGSRRSELGTHKWAQIPEIDSERRQEIDRMLAERRLPASPDGRPATREADLDRPMRAEPPPSSQPRGEAPYPTGMTTRELNAAAARELATETPVPGGAPEPVPAPRQAEATAMPAAGEPVAVPSAPPPAAPLPPTPRGPMPDAGVTDAATPAPAMPSVAALPEPTAPPVPPPPAAAPSPFAPPPGASESAAVFGQPSNALPLGTILFGNGSSRVGREGEAIVRQIAAIQRTQGGSILVVGYASADRGAPATVASRSANLKVSIDRANAVAEALIRAGVEPGRISVDAKADSEQIPGVEAASRRAELFIVF